MKNSIFKKENTSKEILYATTNESKLRIMQTILGDDYKVIGLKDTGIESQTEEDNYYLMYI